MFGLVYDKRMGNWLVMIVLLLVMFSPVAYAEKTLNDINQQVCDRFEEDLVKLAAIMEEVRERGNIKETRVAFGGIDTGVKSADYQITYAAEALAYQRAQKYSYKDQLRYSLEVLKNKVLNAKTQVRKVLDE